MEPQLVNRIVPSPVASKLFPRWVDRAIENPDPEALIVAAMHSIRDAIPCRALALVQGTKGQWRILASNGDLPPLPTEWLSEVLDQGRLLNKESWYAAPVESPVDDGWVLLAAADRLTKEQTSDLDGCAAAIGLLMSTARTQSRLVRRSARLKELLDVTIRWSKSRNTDDLLRQIAEAATRFLRAERATIFMIDRIRKMLVGKPALGIDADELLIPLEAGVVGEAIRSQQPQRVDTDVASEQAMIHRDVDEQLKFQTRSLICVPMVNAAGKVVGAFEVINKLSGNFSDDDEAALLELASHAAIAIENSRHVEQLVASKKQVADQAQNQVAWIGNSPAIGHVKDTIRRVADTDLAILITGQNGTGKEVAAQMIHYLSSRRDHVLVAVNCAALTETLLESELFGHEKGAFTDAHQTRVGKFELANGGTLFLDEIGDMSLGGQAKLLRVLEEKVVVRVGGSTPIPTDARVIAATNQNLAELVREKKFREDLFFRLNVVSINIPPLKDRGDDVMLLASHFLEMFARKVRRDPPRLTAAAQKRLLAHDWPGNVRELRNMMERIAYLSSESTIDAGDLPFIDALRPSDNESTFLADGQTLAEATDRFQAAFIERNIAQTHGNMTEAARIMGLHRSNLYRKMKQLGMDAGG
jgi:Nif-specific regulatory protein